MKDTRLFFHPHSTSMFDTFIANAGLFDLPIGLGDTGLHGLTKLLEK